MRFQTAGIAIMIGAMIVGACSGGAADRSNSDARNKTSSSVAGSEPAVADASDSEPTADAMTPSTTPPLSTARSYDGSQFPAELTAMVTNASTDLARHLSVDPTAIEVGLVEEVVWPNGALGCPRPGMSYTQVPADGLRIVLVHDGIEYVYHSGGTTEPFLCLATAEADAEVPTPDEGGSATGGDGSTSGTLQLETTEPPKDAMPTEEPGGPGGEPDE